MRDADGFGRASFDMRAHTRANLPAGLDPCTVGYAVRPLLELGSNGAASPPAG